jgi:N-acylneuraminate cytidylyltransferase
MFNNRHVAAIVIARGGSKGLLAKNLRPLLGRPMVAWSIDHAKAMRTFDLVALSTDDERIAEVGRGLGIRVVLRPANLADNTARVDDVMRHAVEELECGRGDAGTGGRGEGADTGTPGRRDAGTGNGTAAPSPGPDFVGTTLSQGERVNKLDILVMLYGNVPVRRPGLLDTAVSVLATSGCDSVQSFVSVGKFHPWWTYRMDSDGRVAFADDHKIYRRQELPALYVPDAAAIVIRRDVLMESASRRNEPHAFFGSDRRGIVQADDATIDVDTELDLLVAEAMLRRNVE